MSTSLLLQYAIIAVAVLLSIWVGAKKQFPGSVQGRLGPVSVARRTALVDADIRAAQQREWRL